MGVVLEHSDVVPVEKDDGSTKEAKVMEMVAGVVVLEKGFGVIPLEEGQLRAVRVPR